MSAKLCTSTWLTQFKVYATEGTIASTYTFFIHWSKMTTFFNNFMKKLIYRNIEKRFEFSKLHSAIIELCFNSNSNTSPIIDYCKTEIPKNSLRPQNAISKD